VYLHLRIIKSCLILTSLCMLFEVVTIDFHYMTDRHKRFDLKKKEHSCVPKVKKKFSIGKLI